MLSPRRQVERVAMPMQHGRGSELTQRRLRASRAERNWLKADFLGWSGVHPCTQRPRHELRTKTNAQRRAVCRKPLLQKLQLLRQEGVFIILIGPDGTAKNDDEIGFHRLQRPELVDAYIIIMNFESRLMENRLESAEIFKSKVTDSDSSLEQCSLRNGTCHLIIDTIHYYWLGVRDASAKRQIWQLVIFGA